jgi:hypothetical protein
MLEKFQPKKDSSDRKKSTSLIISFVRGNDSGSNHPGQLLTGRNFFLKIGHLFISNEHNNNANKVEKQRCNVQSPENLPPWRDSNPRSSDSIAETMTMPPRATAETSASVSE